MAKCIAAGLVGGEGFSIDASLIRADVDKKKRTPGDQQVSWPKAEEASRAVREYLTALDAAQNMRRAAKMTTNSMVWDKSTRSDGTFSRADFGTLRYRASKADCDVCAFKMRCCPSTPMRYVPRDLHEDARDVARALAKTILAHEQSRRERKKVEMRFAHMKRIFKLDRLRLRRPERR